jgi:hypothetical protein
MSTHAFLCIILLMGELNNYKLRLFSVYVTIYAKGMWLYNINMLLGNL